ncbi:unnamed protein product [Prunus armeniaca]
MGSGTRAGMESEDRDGEGESPSLVVFRCGTPVTLLRVVTCGSASLTKVMTSQSMALHWPSNTTVHLPSCIVHSPKSPSKKDIGGREVATNLACHRVMWLGKRVPKATQSLHVARLRVPKATQDVARHEGPKGDIKLACHKAMWLGTGVPKGRQSLHVAKQCD